MCNAVLHRRYNNTRIFCNSQPTMPDLKVFVAKLWIRQFELLLVWKEVKTKFHPMVTHLHICLRSFHSFEQCLTLTYILYVRWLCVPLLYVLKMLMPFLIHARVTKIRAVLLSYNATFPLYVILILYFSLFLI